LKGTNKEKKKYTENGDKIEEEEFDGDEELINDKVS
jgi:hypothetical protein